MRNILLAYLITGLILAAIGFTPSGKLALDCLHSYGILAWVGVMYLLYQLVTFVVYGLLIWLTCLYEERKHGRN